MVFRYEVDLATLALEHVDLWLVEHPRYCSDYDHRSRAVRAKRRQGRIFPTDRTRVSLMDCNAPQT